MNTLAVMCMALTSTSPSRMPLVRTIFSTVGVMFSKAHPLRQVERQIFGVRFHSAGEPPAPRFQLPLDATARRSRCCALGTGTNGETLLASLTSPALAAKPL